MKEPFWVLPEVVGSIHGRQLAEHGGVEGIRDAGLLASALDKPKNLFFYGGEERDIPDLAASYASGIIKNHPFVDGNKRTAFVTCRLFLHINHLLLTAPQTEKYLNFVGLASGKISDAEFAFWLRNHCEHT